VKGQLQETDFRPPLAASAPGKKLSSGLKKENYVFPGKVTIAVRQCWTSAGQAKLAKFASLAFCER